MFGVQTTGKFDVSSTKQIGVPVPTLCRKMTTLSSSIQYPREIYYTSFHVETWGGYIISENDTFLFPGFIGLL